MALIRKLLFKARGLTRILGGLHFPIIIWQARTRCVLRTARAEQEGEKEGH